MSLDQKRALEAFIKTGKYTKGSNEPKRFFLLTAKTGDGAIEPLTQFKERGVLIFREQFYNLCNLLADSIGAMRLELHKAQKNRTTIDLIAY